MLSLRSIWRGADYALWRQTVAMRPRSFGTEVPQDDATWEFIFKLSHYPCAFDDWQFARLRQLDHTIHFGVPALRSVLIAVEIAAG